MNIKKQKIIVAMSGGVDSSVAAALLARKGYSVEGAYMKLFDGRDKSSERATRAVAKKLGIELKVLDLRKEFKKRVIDCFLNEFEAGCTPNPCVVCNQQIKFGLLLDKALDRGADFVATGHYARIENCHCEEPRFAGRRSNLGDISEDHHILFCGHRDDAKKFLIAKDSTKDQSYFLYNLTQEKLPRILFPLGEYKKLEIYQMAEKWQIPYKKGESMDICFVEGKSHREFLRKNLGIKAGKIIDTTGKILGKHQGLWFYTIGQRADIGGPGPFYVARLDRAKNEVVVTNNFRDSLLVKKNLIAENVNWISGKIPKLPLKCGARIRYGHAVVPCVIASEAKQSQEKITRLTRFRQLAGRSNAQINYLVKFKNPQRAITPGQSVVFYKRNEVLGGGIIS